MAQRDGPVCTQSREMRGGTALVWGFQRAAWRRGAALRICMLASEEWGATEGLFLCLGNSEFWLF